MQICHVCIWKTDSFRVVTGLSFMIMEQGMCVSCFLMHCRSTIRAGLGKSLGLLTPNVHNLPWLGKRKGSQLADFKHTQFTSRAFGFIPVQFDRFLLPSLSKSLMF